MRGALRTFSFWVANGTVGHPLLDDVDYPAIFEAPSALEQAYAIFAKSSSLTRAGRSPTPSTPSAGPPSSF